MQRPGTQRTSTASGTDNAGTPQKAFIWGTRLDAWRLLEGPVLEDELLTVGVQNLREPAWQGHVVLDVTAGMVVQMWLPPQGIAVVALDETAPGPEQFTVMS